MEGVTCPSCGHECDRFEEICPLCGCRLPKWNAAGNGAIECTEDAGVLDDGDPFASAAQHAVIRLGPTRIIELTVGDRLVLGRSDDSPIADLVGDNISRRHAEIFVNQLGIFVQDTDSTNGTFIEGSRLLTRDPQQIESVTKVRLGSDPPFHLTVEVSREDER